MEAHIPERLDWHALDEESDGGQHCHQAIGNQTSPDDNFMPRLRHNAQQKEPYSCFAGGYVEYAETL